MVADKNQALSLKINHFIKIKFIVNLSRILQEKLNLMFPEIA